MDTTADQTQVNKQPQPEKGAPPNMDASEMGDHKEDDHVGATEDQISDTPAPAGNAYKDEPKQG